jgi:hypothetical protein
MSQSQIETHLKTYAGGCHCGAVRFEVDLDLEKGVAQCNCTLCTKRGASGVIVKPGAFRLLTGEGALGDYAWAQRTAHYHFCSRCGIHAFGRGNLPQLGGEYVSVNVRCLDDVDLATLKVVYWDGRHDNWMAGPRDRPWPIAPAVP